MALINWAAESLNDIDSISEFIARDSKFYAKQFVKSIFSATSQLEVFPEIGRVVPEINSSDIREILLGHYRIIYKYEETFDRITILTVYHLSRIFNQE